MLNDDLIIQNMDRVKLHANRLAKKFGSNVDKDDLISAGYEGLVRAARKFNKSKASFTTFADIKIIGYMYNSIQANDYLKPSQRKKIKDNLMQEIEHFYLDDPDCSLQNTLGDNSLPIDDQLFKNYDSKRIIDMFFSAFDVLSDKYKLYVLLYYYKELTLYEIGYIFGLSEGAICQHLNRSKYILTAELGEQL